MYFIEIVQITVELHVTLNLLLQQLVSDTSLSGKLAFYCKVRVSSFTEKNINKFVVTSKIVTDNFMGFGTSSFERSVSRGSPGGPRWPKTILAVLCILDLESLFQRFQLTAPVADRVIRMGEMKNCSLRIRSKELLGRRRSRWNDIIQIGKEMWTGFFRLTRGPIG
jgi:hypothetical protein